VETDSVRRVVWSFILATVSIPYPLVVINTAKQNIARPDLWRRALKHAIRTAIRTTIVVVEEAMPAVEVFRLVTAPRPSGAIEYVPWVF
jgi:hypothetical protein